MTAMYARAIQMPSSYVVMDAEEMTYLEGGGYVAYRGWEAWQKITFMVATVCSWAGTAAHLMSVAAASVCATAVGTLIAVVQALGAMLSIVAAGVQGVMVGTALMLTVYEGGFRASDTGLFGWTWTTVKPL